MASSIICWAQPVTAAHAGHPGYVLWVIGESSLHPCLPVPTLPVPTLPLLTLPVLTLPVLAAQRSTGDVSLRVQSSQLPPAPGVRGKGVTLLP